MDTEFYLKVAGDSSANNQLVKIYDGSSATDGYYFKVEHTTSGNVKIVPKTGELYNRVLALETTEGSGSDVQQRDYVDDSNYKDEWEIVRELQYWNSTGNEISYWEEDPTIYFDDFAQQEWFVEAYTRAIARWENALGIDIEQVDSAENADIVFYSVTRQQYEQLQQRTPPTDELGITQVLAQDDALGFHDGFINIKTLHSAEVYVYSNGNKEKYITTVLHELGHALGYMDHSPDSSDVMYKEWVDNVNHLTQDEINHLNQVYTMR